MHRLIVGADDGKKIPLFLPIGEDALDRLQHKLGKMSKVLVDAAPWSADLKKDIDKNRAKL